MPRHRYPRCCSRQEPSDLWSSSWTPSVSPEGSVAHQACAKQIWWQKTNIATNFKVFKQSVHWTFSASLILVLSPRSEALPLRARNRDQLCNKFAVWYLHVNTLTNCWERKHSESETDAYWSWSKSICSMTLSGMPHANSPRAINSADLGAWSYVKYSSNRASF